MDKNNIRTSNDALIYLTDCTLATVEGMAIKKSRLKSEFIRQISITQVGMDYIIYTKIIFPNESRIREIIFMHNGSVAKWASKYMLECCDGGG